MSKQVKFSCNNFSKGLEDMPSQLTHGVEKISSERVLLNYVQMKFFLLGGCARSIQVQQTEERNQKNWNESCLSEGRESQGTREEAGDEASGLVMAWRSGEWDVRMGFWVFFNDISSASLRVRRLCLIKQLNMA